MPNCRLRWPECSSSADTRPNMWKTQGCTKPRIMPFGNAPSIMAQSLLQRMKNFPIRASASRSAPSIVWLRIGNASRHALLAWLEPRLPVIEARLSQSDKLIEVR